MLQSFTESSFTKVRAWYFAHTPSYAVGRQGVVGIAIRYGLDRPGIEFQWGPNFLHPYYLITSVVACSPGGDSGARECRCIVFGRCEPVDVITGLVVARLSGQRHIYKKAISHILRLEQATY